MITNKEDKLKESNRNNSASYQDRYKSFYKFAYLYGAFFIAFSDKFTEAEIDILTSKITEEMDNHINWMDTEKKKHGNFTIEEYAEILRGQIK